ncbi:MauE/DoxX family redox-associated membrane protein [Mucilaginibacter sp.]
MAKKTTVEIIAALLVLLFIYAAVNKLMNYNHFKFTLGSSPLIGKLSPMVATAIPIAEILIASLLIRSGTLKLGLYLSLSLLVLFTIYLIGILSFSTHIPCACGGILQKLSWKAHIVFNVCCILINIVALRLLKINKDPFENSEITFA